MARKSCTSSPDLLSSFLASPPKSEVLEQLATLVDWAELRRAMEPMYKFGGAGREPVDPVLLFKLLLLERLYQLSDGEAVWMAKDSLSFRQFLGLGASDAVPDDTTLVVFRRRLREAGLLDELFAAVTVQLERQGIGVRQGHIKIVDATLIKAAVRPPRKGRADGGDESQTDGGDGPTGAGEPPLDPDADFTVKAGQPHYGYKLHLAQDRQTGLITHHVLTPASVHDSQVFADLVDGSEGEVLADKGYDSKAARDLVRRLGGKPSIMKRAKPDKPLSAWHRGRNKSIGRMRSFIESTNAVIKRWYGCGRATYIGLERVMMQMTMGVLAYNLTRAVALQRGKCA
jgi:IS5 family transposase